MFNLFRKKEPIGNFWQWFLTNKSKFEIDPETTDVGPALDSLMEQLMSVSGGLAIEVSREFNGVRDIVISAEGDKDKFAIVQEIVDKAPAIDRWTVTAFRQRTSENFVLETPQLKYDTSQMHFLPLIEEGEIDLVIFTDGLKGIAPETIFQFGIIVMDNVLGEYDSVMKVRRYDFRDLSDAEGVAGVKPLSELTQFVDDFFQRVNN